MDEAASPAAECLIGLDDERGRRASRRGVGSLTLADEPREVGRLIADDFGLSGDAA